MAKAKKASPKKAKPKVEDETPEEPKVLDESNAPGEPPEVPEPPTPEVPPEPSKPPVKRIVIGGGATADPATVGERIETSVRKVEVKDLTTNRIDLEDRVTETKTYTSGITEAEAISLGFHRWHLYRLSKPGNLQFTTVIGGRRFLINEEIFTKLKDGGLAEQEDVR